MAWYRFEAHCESRLSVFEARTPCCDLGGGDFLWRDVRAGTHERRFLRDFGVFANPNRSRVHSLSFILGLLFTKYSMKPLDLFEVVVSLLENYSFLMSFLRGHADCSMQPLSARH